MTELKKWLPLGRKV